MNNVAQFPRTGHVDLMMLALGVLGNGPASANEIVETLRKKSYFGVTSETVEQAIDGLRRNGYPVESDGNVYWLGDSPKGAA